MAETEPLCGEGLGSATAPEHPEMEQNRRHSVDAPRGGATECRMRALILKLLLFIGLTAGAVTFYALPYLSLEPRGPTVVAALGTVAPI
jgi:hypothetical protein